MSQLSSLDHHENQFDLCSSGHLKAQVVLWKYFDSDSQAPARCLLLDVMVVLLGLLIEVFPEEKGIPQWALRPTAQGHLKGAAQ